ncbi:hypothetical protein [uncultured Sulfitobacter sp.]|uniref:hypothetical protein n=1 Tax=uncultured Sulfitobacter sp. TaxID=191468 RepID=UPI00261A865E|nr:hypothetical protein [uncultured Sulfitobacter sp.]
MPIVIAILTALAGAVWWWVRQNPREAIHTAQDVATTLKNAPRRLAFRRQTNAHPVEGIDDPRIAICAIAQSFLELDTLPTIEQRDRLHMLLRSKLRCTEAEAEEMEVLGRWLVTQCNGAREAVPRLGRRLRKIDDGSAWDRMQDVLASLVGDDLSPAQVDAVDDLRIAFKR